VVHGGAGTPDKTVACGGLKPEQRKQVRRKEQQEKKKKVRNKKWQKETAVP